MTTVVCLNMQREQGIVQLLLEFKNSKTSVDARYVRMPGEFALDNSILELRILLA